MEGIKARTNLTCLGKHAIYENLQTRIVLALLLLATTRPFPPYTPISRSCRGKLSTTYKTIKHSHTRSDHTTIPRHKSMREPPISPVPGTIPCVKLKRGLFAATERGRTPDDDTSPPLTQMFGIVHRRVICGKQLASKSRACQDTCRQ